MWTIIVETNAETYVRVMINTKLFIGCNRHKTCDFNINMCYKCCGSNLLEIIHVKTVTVKSNVNAKIV